MKNILDVPKTAMEVFNMLPEGTLCEVIDNVLYMSPSPTINHQRILGDIFSEIRLFNKINNSGEVFLAPCDVYLNDGESVVQPDIVFIALYNSNIIQRKGIYGSPDLVIEILSYNKNYDRENKFELYLQNAIPEYIIIDADTKETWHYILTEGKYMQEQTYPPGDLYIKQLNLTVSF